MQSALGGLVVLVLAVMAKYVMNRLWQKTLMSSASDALSSIESFGLRVHAPGFGPVIRATGQCAGESVCIEWRGGVRGETSRYRVGKRKGTLPLIRTRGDVQRVLLGGEE